MFHSESKQNSKQGQDTTSPEDCESLLPSSDIPDTPTYPPPTRSRPPHWIAISGIVAGAAIFAALAGYWVGKATSMTADLDKACMERVAQFSPVLEDVDVEHSVVRFNGSLLKENVYRQDASPEVDAAWMALGVDYRAVAIPADQAKDAGMLPDQVKIREKYGGGFPANVEGMHQLHCLNLLRKSLYYNFDYYHALGQGPFSNSDFIIRKHVSHCLDILRQQLMCTVDVGVMGQVWFQPPDQAPEAFVDFNTQHKCRNFDAVRKWAEEHQLPEHVAADFLQPPAEGDTIYTTIP